MKFNSKSLHARLIKHLREWHRKLGIIAAFFIIFLSLSGVALNHTDSLALAHQPISNTWLLDHYGISSPLDVRFYQQDANQGKDKLYITNNLLWFNNKVLMESSSEIVATTFISTVRQPESQIILVATSSQISLFNLDGDLIDQLGEDFGVPAQITAINVHENDVVVKAELGYFTSNTDFLDWQSIEFIEEPSWITPIDVSKSLTSTAELAYRSRFLTLERIILDAHSGRILGLFGVLFMDAVAILLILLSLSGIYIWLRYARAKR